MSNYIDGIGLKQGIGKPQGGNGYFGGSSQDDSATPATKGFFFVFFALPGHIFKGALPSADAQQYLLNAAIDWTPPGDRQLNTVEDKSIGGNVSNHITGHQTSNEFSITYKEFASGSLVRIHRKWSAYIDPYLGGSTIADTFAPNEYKGKMMVIQTKPITRVNKEQWKESDIIKVDLFDGVFCTQDPLAPFGNGVEQNERINIPAQYKFDGQPLNESVEGVMEQALDVLRSKDIYEQTAKLYEELSVSSSIKESVSI